MRIRDGRNSAITRPAIFPGVLRVAAAVLRPTKMICWTSLSACFRHAQVHARYKTRFSERIIASLYEYLTATIARTFLLSRGYDIKRRQKRRSRRTTFNGEFIPQNRTVVARYNCCRNGICKWTVNRAAQEAALSTARKNHRVTQIEKYISTHRFSSTPVYYTL